MFIHTNQPLITLFYIKKSAFFFGRIGDESALIRNFCATGASGGKPIGRVRVELNIQIKVEAKVFHGLLKEFQVQVFIFFI